MTRRPPKELVHARTMQPSVVVGAGNVDQAMGLVLYGGVIVLLVIVGIVGVAIASRWNGIAV